MAQLTMTRAELGALFPNNPKAIREFDKLFQQAGDNSEAITLTVAATQELQDATAITLSPNDALNNERVLAAVPPIELFDEGVGGRLIIQLANFEIEGGHTLILNLLTNTSVTLPPSGRLLSATVSDVYANDAAALADGLSSGEAYRHVDGTVHWAA